MPGTGKKVIQPISDPNADAKPDLNTLLAKEEEKEQLAQIMGNAGIVQPPTPAPQPGQVTQSEDDPASVAL